MEEYREKDGYIDLDKILPDHPYRKHFNFSYQGKTYFYRQVRSVKNCYHELIAEELASDFGLPCAHYDLASAHHELGYISENIFSEDETVLRLGDLLVEEYSKKESHEVPRTNNFKDIKRLLWKRYHRFGTVDRLMDQLLQIFFFDVLIGNIDRHADNLFLVEKKRNVSFSPLLDNELMLNPTSIEHGGYSLGIDREDYFYAPEEMEGKENFLAKYFRSCSSQDIQFFESKLDIISEENIEDVLRRVETRISAPIHPTIRKQILDGFAQNRNMIYNVIRKYTKRR